MLEILRYPIPWDSFPLFGYLCLQHLLLLIIVQLSIIDQGHWSTHLPTPGPIHPIDANFYRFHQLIQYPLCFHPNPPLHLPNQFFIVSPFCLFLRSCLEAACKDSKVGKHGDNEVAGANIEGQHFVPKRQTLSPIYALAKILKEYMR